MTTAKARRRMAEMLSEEKTDTPRPLEELVDEFGGPERVSRLAGVHRVHFWKLRKGKVVPQRTRATKIAAVFGLRPEEVEWPRGFTRDPLPRVPPRRESPKVDMSGVYEDGALKAELEALIEREVQRRMATQTAAQTQDAEGN